MIKNKIDLGAAFEKFKEEDMEILNVYITKKKFIVSIYRGVIEIDRDEFDEWANEEQKREGIEVYPGNDGEPVERESTMSWREYYGSPRFYKDIAEYILLKELKPTP